MSSEINHIYAIHREDNSIIHIDEVPNGLMCNCICSKCNKPLIAKNSGHIRIHHFAHIAESNCNGETLIHLMAKSIIKEKKYLWIKNGYGLITRIDFIKVSEEKNILDSSFIADLICHTKQSRVIIEIIVTHEIDEPKKEFLINNKITSLRIDLTNAGIDDFNVLPNNFDDLILRNSNRNWIHYNNEFDAEPPKKEIEEEKSRRIIKSKIIRKNKTRYTNLDPELLQFHNALREIWLNNRDNLIYGKIKPISFTSYSRRSNKILCIESDNLSKLYNNLAILIEIHQNRFVPLIEKKVGVRIIQDAHSPKMISIPEYNYFPQCVIFSVESFSINQLLSLRDKGFEDGYLNKIKFLNSGFN